MFSIDVDITSIPTSTVDFLTALGTVGAAVFAGWAIYRESNLRKENRKLRADDAQKEIDREAALAAAQEAHDLAARRAQAELVIAWYDRQAMPRHHRTNDTPYPDFWEPGVIIANHSAAPVFDLRVSIYDDLTHQGHVYDPKPVFLRTAENETAELPSGFPPAPTIHAVVTFRDLAGVWWKRYQFGELRELSEQEVAKLSTGA